MRGFGMLLIPAIATPVNTVFRSVLDGRTTEHPPRPCRRVLAFLGGGHPDFAVSWVSPIADSTRGFHPRTIWRDPRQAGQAPNSRGGGG